MTELEKRAAVCCATVLATTFTTIQKQAGLSAATTPECGTTQVSDSIGDRDAYKAVATVERVTSDGSYAAADGDKRQATTVLERFRPKEVTLLGMVTLVRPLHLPKADCPMEVTPVPIVTRLRPL